MAATAPPPEVRYRRPGRLACGVRAFRLFHYTGLVPVHGGWVGVDVFFVIGGHLTTGILVREHCRRGAIDLRRFYVRRARPLFPALAGLLLGVGLYLLVADPDLDPLMELLPALLYLMNWVGAFDIHDAVLTGHTRSLAIEEQYYFSWLCYLSRWRHGRTACAAWSLVWRCC